MRLSSKHQLGRLELIRELKLGKRGEFFEANDTRNGRRVGVHILPFDQGHPFRFGLEHRALSKLRHPHILTIQSLRTLSGVSYLVTEHASGESLESVLKRGQLPVPQAIRHGHQIAQALAAAHASGVFHRDLNAQDVIVDPSGNIKVMGFGLASSGDPLSADPETHADLLALGAILQEMLGAHPVPPPLNDVIHGALPSAAAASQAFECISESTAEPPPPAVEAPPRPPSRIRVRALELWDRARTRIEMPGWISVVLAILVLLAAGDLLLHLFAGRPPAPSFRRMTFRHGAIFRARFAQHGKSVVYSARFEGTPQSSFVVSLPNLETGSLDLPAGATVVAVSSKDDLAIRLLDGTLIRRPLRGGETINEASGVLDADWSPDGEKLAIARYNPERARFELEYPIGKELYDSAGLIDLVRVSPRGDRVAFAVADGPEKRLWVVTTRGESKQLASLGPEGVNRSLSWSSNGKEIWAGAGTAKDRGKIQVIRLDGKSRLVDWLPETILDDLHSGGDALVQVDRGWSGARVRLDGKSLDTDLSWNGEISNVLMSRDGRFAFFTESGTASGSGPAVYVRSIDGSPPRKLAQGTLVAVSPDAKWISVFRTSPKPDYSLVPVAGGKEQAVEILSLDNQTAPVVGWLSGDRYLVWGNEPQNAKRHFLYTPETEQLKPVSPEGSTLGLVSDDGTHLLTAGPNRTWSAISVEQGDSHPVEGILPTDQLLRWDANGESILVGHSDDNRLDFSIFRVQLSTGARTLLKHVEPDVQSDGAIPAALTPDGKSYAYLFYRAQSDLFFAHGLN